MNNSNSSLDSEPYFQLITKRISEGASNRSIANDVHTSEMSIRRFRKRHRLPLPDHSSNTSQTKVDGNNAEVRTSAQVGPYQFDWRILDDPDKMLRERGLDPTEWSIDSATVNEWDGPSPEGPITYHQAKLHLKRKIETQILAARSDGWKAPALISPRATQDKSKLIIVAGDHQAPFYDERLHDLFCGFLEENEPEEIVLLGDTIDLPDISRHRLDPENTAIVNECIQSGYDLLRGIRVSAKKAKIKIIPGNHDERLRNILLDKPSAQALYGVKRADTDEDRGESVLALSHLLRLDELNIEYVDPHGPYELGQINLSDKLAVRHGWIVRKGSGNSALATLDHLGYSCITGHTHRQSMVHHTKHEIDGQLRQIVGVEAGCMCRVNQTLIEGRKWPNFTTAPDWQQGFCVVNLWPDGSFKIDLATYVNDILYWRNKRYR